ncbi:MAG TPA: hypothetical protein V6D17_14945 [Candidatus Obscuribacterales bacterium]
MSGQPPDPLSLINKFAERERELSESHVLAPVVAGGRVRVRVGGIIYELALNDTKYDGWAILKVVDPGKAVILGEPSPKQISQYLKLFPRLRFVLIDRFKDDWWGLLASTGERNIVIEGAVPLRLVDRGMRFATVNVRCDGSQFWYEDHDRRHNPAIASYLRKSLEEEVPPHEIRFAGMVPAEKLAYKMLYLNLHPEYRITAPPGSLDERIREALTHADAQLDSFWNVGADRVTIRFQINGITHTCQVREADLTVMSAGICLSGRDQDFDLASLVGVLRQSDGRYEYYE